MTRLIYPRVKTVPPPETSFNYQVIASYAIDELKNMLKKNNLSPQYKRIIRFEILRRKNKEKQNI